ncbi:MAG: hypothetical protein M3Q36_00540 [bacterium]|nr:hypothetical protein [bacterium]
MARLGESPVFNQAVDQFARDFMYDTYSPDDAPSRIKSTVELYCEIGHLDPEMIRLARKAGVMEAISRLMDLHQEIEGIAIDDQEI